MFSHELKTYNANDIMEFHDKLLSRMSILAVKLKGHTALDHEEFDLLDRIIPDLQKLHKLQIKKISK